jgi:hypothetical protein
VFEEKHKGLSGIPEREVVVETWQTGLVKGEGDLSCSSSNASPVRENDVIVVLNIGDIDEAWQTLLLFFLRLIVTSLNAVFKIPLRRPEYSADAVMTLDSAFAFAMEGCHVLVE